MAQYLKDEVQQRIAGAALEVFAGRGFAGATMAEIARVAGVSTGNVYRYYDGKEALFHALVPPAFAETVKMLLRRRGEALAGVEDYRTLPPDAEYTLLSAETLDFAVENRLRLVILLARAEGTRYEGFAGELVGEMAGLALAHFRGLRPGLRVSRAMRFGLTEIYRSFVSTLAAVLERFDDGAQIREALEGVSRYHRIGLGSFFA